MPYRSYKKNYYSKNYRKSGYYNKSGKKKGNIFYRRLRNKSYYMAKKALSMLNVEYKEHNLITTSVPIVDIVGTIYQLTNIPQGDTTQTRDGNQCKLTAINIKGIYNIHASATNSFVRIILVLDKQTNQAIYATSDLLLDTTAQDSINSPLQLNNRHRFVVLYDKVFLVSNSGTGARKINIYKKLQIPIRFDNSAGAISSLTSNSLSVIFISNESTNRPNLSFISRIRYVDN